MTNCTNEGTLVAPPTVEPAPSSEPAKAFSIIDQLLRDRKGLLARIESGEDLTSLAKTMIITIMATAFVFGASLGLLRGGVQIAYAGIKLPLVILLTAGLCTPVIAALKHVVVGHTDVRRDLALVLSSLALGSLVIAALAPLIMLAVGRDVDYHTLILLAVGCCFTGGAFGLSFFIRGTRELTSGSRVLIVSVCLLFVALVGTQMTWTFRPYLVRPRTEDVPVMRSLEGSFLESVSTSIPSAMGIYTRQSAPLPEAMWEEGGVR